MISRYRLGVTAKNLERFTFNVKPDRDPVAMTDEPTKNLQHIECTAPEDEPLACHSVTRSLCEMMTTCGGSGRPFLCECNTIFGYEKPELLPGLANTTLTFEEVCSDAVR